MIEQKIFIDNLEINYKVAGEGEKTLLILHGWGSKSDYWQKVGNLLVKKGIKVVIPDLPGFGKSNKPPLYWSLNDYCIFVEHFADQLKLEKFCLLGHSFGGALASKCALKFPEKINKLFLVSAALIRRRTVRKKIIFLVSKIFKIFGYIPILKKAFYKFIVKSDYPGTKGFMRKTYLNVIKEDLSDSIENIKTPTVLIWGQNDEITPLKQGELIKSKIKGSKLIIIPQGTHDLERKFPEALANKITC